MNDRLIRRASGAQRIALSAVAVAASVYAGLWLTSVFNGGWHYSVLDALRPQGFLIFACYGASLAIGLILHGLPELGRRGRFGPAGVAVGLLLIYGLAIGLLAWPLAAGTPSPYDFYDRSTPDPSPLYLIWLCCVLLPIAFAVCAGQLFPRSGAGGTAGESSILTVFTRGRIPLLAGIGWLIGAIVLVVLLIAIAVS